MNCYLLQIKMKIINIICLIVLFFSPIVIITSCEQKKSTSEGKNKIEKSNKLNHVSRISVKEKILRNPDSLSVLEDNLDYVLANKMLEDGGDLANLYRANVSKLSPEALAKLVKDKNGTFGLNMVDLVARRDDLNFAKDFFGLISDDEVVRENYVRLLGVHSSMCNPENLAEFLNAIKNLSQNDRIQIAVGITSKLANDSDRQHRIQLINEYFQSNDDPIISRELAKAAVADMKTQEAIEWLKSSPPELVSSGDRSLFANMKSSDYPKGFEFINYLLDSNQSARAKNAMESFMFVYGPSDPQGAIKWVETLDPSLQTNQLYYTPLMALYRKDQDSARRLLESVSNPKIKSFILKSFEDVDKLKK